MNLLGAKLYDPAVAVNKATSALLAMTALDTTNLRLAVTVPAHGMLRVRLRCAVMGAVTFPQIMLGVLNGATVVGRVTPHNTINGTALATTRMICDAEFTITGLTPGAITLDAAYGVELVVAATNLTYGGPNDATTNNAWGGFIFEIWDPQPMATAGQLSIDAAGRVDLGKIVGDAVAAANLGKSTKAIGRGTCAAGGSVTSITTSSFTPGPSSVNQFKNRVVLFDDNTTTAALRGQMAAITASTNAATPTFTVGTMTAAPASGDTFSVL